MRNKIVINWNNNLFRFHKQLHNELEFDLVNKYLLDDVSQHTWFTKPIWDGGEILQYGLDLVYMQGCQELTVHRSQWTELLRSWTALTERLRNSIHVCDLNFSVLGDLVYMMIHRFAYLKFSMFRVGLSIAPSWLY